VNRIFQNEGFNVYQISHCARNLIVRRTSWDPPPPDHETSNGVKGARCEEGEGLFEGQGISCNPVFQPDAGLSIPLEVQHEVDEHFRAVKYQFVRP